MTSPCRCKRVGVEIMRGYKITDKKDNTYLVPESQASFMAKANGRTFVAFIDGIAELEVQEIAAVGDIVSSVADFHSKIPKETSVEDIE